MEKVLTNAQMRAADRHTIENLNISAEQLMKRAGEAIAEDVVNAAEKLNTKDILIVCGTGNNGGDGYVCAQTLLNRGLKVKVYAFEGALSADCQRERYAYKGGYSRDICGAIVVDCIFGTGLSREITGEFAEVINKINSSGAYVISADIPSGINGDNGKICGCAVKADLTVAIAELKIGMFLNDGIDFCGKIVKKDIGIACPESGYAYINFPADIAEFYPKRRRNSHKGTYGSANIIAGSEKYIGAAALSLGAALKSGCGYVKLTTCNSVKLSLASKFPQAIFLNEPDLTSSAIAAGMGCGVSEEFYSTLSYLLKNYNGKLIIDADGLNCISKFGKGVLLNKNCEVILTPHVKEFSRLTGLSITEILQDPAGAAKSFAKEYGVVLLLKGAASIITDGERTAVNITGNSALAKGGSGDILSGYMCGCLARGLKSFDAAVCAAYTLGLSAEICAEEKTEYCATAMDILNNLHFAVKRLTK